MGGGGRRWQRVDEYHCVVSSKPALPRCCLLFSAFRVRALLPRVAVCHMRKARVNFRDSAGWRRIKYRSLCYGSMAAGMARQRKSISTQSFRDRRANAAHERSKYGAGICFGSFIGCQRSENQRKACTMKKNSKNDISADISMALMLKENISVYGAHLNGIMAQTSR